ncbi:MAG: ATP-dependent 6-phosphofructokinase [Planctomycetes bacterium]|nr:ATP-dependent 6-phosphofructokinase [Planctomycetota bacterium]
MPTAEAVRIHTLGPCTVRSPLKLSTVWGDGVANFVGDDARMPLEVEVNTGRPRSSEAMFEKAGPRERIYFDPPATTAAIVTCGGLCPGLNNVIRSLVLELHHHYGVGRILGIRYGYMGLDPANGLEPMALTTDAVDDIHTQGGTVLGSSRGPVDLDRAVAFLRDRGVNILFCIGGDGTQRGALALANRAAAAGHPLAVVGVPKTIDNDIRYVWRTFGYYTALEKAREIVTCAHVEAKGAPRGVTLVKLMGRDAGFIAAGTAVASQDVNFVLVPEVPFVLEGPGGLLDCLRQRMERRDHAVILVAEGAGQDQIPAGQQQRDASGNLLHQDIGPHLAQRIKDFFKRIGSPVNLRYIDPSYIIRSVPADCEDALLCDQLARHAVHAAMAGKTEMLIGQWYNVFTHVPIALAVAQKKYMSTESELWRAALAATGQPAHMTGPQAGQP